MLARISTHSHKISRQVNTSGFKRYGTFKRDEPTILPPLADTQGQTLETKRHSRKNPNPPPVSPLSSSNMSTQDPKHPPIPFSITAQPYQNVRLLEAPDELLDIIVNTQQKLYFKSSPPTGDTFGTTGTTGNSAQSKQGNLHLCADEKVWAVKQVSTSNSIYVTRTCGDGTARGDGDGGGGGGGGGDGDDGEMMDVDSPSNSTPPHGGISVVAKPTSTLELLAIPATNHEAIVLEHLDRLVPTISSVDDLDALAQGEAGGSGSAGSTLSELHTHIPAPTSAITQVLARKCVCEIPWPPQPRPWPRPRSGNATDTKTKSQVFIPSPRLLLSTWHAIMQAATLTDTAITGPENARILVGTTPNDGDDDDDEERRTKLLHATIAARLFDPAGHFAALGVIHTPTASPTPTPAPTARIHERECTRWVGNIILAAQRQREHQREREHEHDENGPALSQDAFEKRWEDAVPAAWMGHCTVAVLGPACRLNGDGDDRVGWAPFALEGADPAASAGAGAGAGGETMSGAPGAQPAGKNKRKWHEKFAARRRLN